ncbi:MAG: hypothetical protein VXW65_14540 [Pseudomonadota bacterium]|nr:hypothetical protein [Pseudomonadota bacterium]
MTRVSEYKLVVAPQQTDGDAQEHIEDLRNRYGSRLTAVFYDGQQVFPEIVRACDD